MSIHHGPVLVPAPRPYPLDLPLDYTRVRETEPISRISLPNGLEAWLVTRYEDARAVLADPGLFSSDRRQAEKPRRSFNEVFSDSIIFMDPPDHPPIW